LSLVHNWVVADVRSRNAGMLSNKMVNYSGFGYGFADLVHSTTGEVWEVKKSTVSVTSALRQLGRYTAGSLQDSNYSNLDLHAGGTRGTVIAPNSFVKTVGFDTYFVNYWDVGNGIIQYDYRRVTDWQKVGEAAIATVIVGGCTFLIVKTGGLAAPVLVPVAARAVGG